MTELGAIRKLKAEYETGEEVAVCGQDTKSCLTKLYWLQDLYGHYIRFENAGGKEEAKVERKQ